MNELVDEYTNTYYCSIDADYSALTEDIKSGLKAPKSKVGDKVTTDKYKDNFSEGYTKNRSGETFVIYTVFKTNPWTYKTKDLNGETIIGSLYENCCCVNLNELLFTTR